MGRHGCGRVGAAAQLSLLSPAGGERVPDKVRRSSAAAARSVCAVQAVNVLNVVRKTAAAMWRTPIAWLACWTQATLSGNSLRQTVHTHRASVHQAAKLAAALLRVAGVTAGLAEIYERLPPGL